MDKFTAKKYADRMVPAEADEKDPKATFPEGNEKHAQQKVLEKQI